MDITQATADSLSKKLDTLDLTDAEIALLAGIVKAASPRAEVEGHGWDEGVAAFTLGFNGVKCDVHPWLNPAAPGRDGSRGVVINHEEQ